MREFFLIAAMMITPAVAADFSGRWEGMGKAVDKPGYMRCTLWLAIARTNSTFTEEKLVICDDVLMPFPSLTLKVRDNDLLHDDKIVGWITDRAVQWSVTTKDVTVDSHLTLADPTLNVSLVLNYPDGRPMGGMEAVLKRVSPL
jgi:hypothetical protein